MPTLSVPAKFAWKVWKSQATPGQGSPNPVLQHAASGERIFAFSQLAVQVHRCAEGEAVKKTKEGKKITLNKETLLRLQSQSLELRDAGVGGGNTGPSCEIFKACTIAGWDCSGNC